MRRALRIALARANNAARHASRAASRCAHLAQGAAAAARGVKPRSSIQRRSYLSNLISVTRGIWRSSRHGVSAKAASYGALRGVGNSRNARRSGGKRGAASLSQAAASIASAGCFQHAHRHRITAPLLRLPVRCSAPRIRRASLRCAHCAARSRAISISCMARCCKCESVYRHENKTTTKAAYTRQRQHQIWHVTMVINKRNSGGGV